MNTTSKNINRYVIPISIFVAILVILGIYILYIVVGNLIQYIVLSIILSYLLSPFIDRLQSYGMKRIYAVSMGLPLVILSLVALSKGFIPALGSQLRSLANKLNEKNFQDLTQRIDNLLHDNLPFLFNENFLSEQLFNTDNDFTTTLTTMFNLQEFSSIAAGISDVFSFVIDQFMGLFIILFITFFFLKDGSKFIRQILKIVPNGYFEATIHIMGKIREQLNIYIRSILVQSVIVATLSSISLSIVGVENALSIGLFIGLANTIPYLGPLLGYILSIIIAIIETGDFSLVLPVIAAIFFVQITDNVVLQPFIFSRSTKMHPIFIMLLILIGARLAGVIGMLLALPIATIFKITFERIQWCLKNYHVFISNEKG